VASDASSLEGFCDEYMPLADGTVGSIAHSGVEMRSVSGVPLPILWRPLEHQEHDESMHGFNHHTRKEIAEQPCAIRRTDAGLRDVALPPAVLGARRLLIIGCGSSLYAAATAKPFIERMTGVPCDIEIASEFRYRCAPLVERTVGILVSQSGETADTISSLELLSEAGIPTVAVVNVPESSLLRGADIVWPTCAGQEIGVAATKTFTSQIVALLRLGLAIAAGRGLDGSQACIEVERAISAAAETCAAAEILEPVIEDIALRISEEREALFIGRGWGFAVAGEAALKLKELSYLRADAYAAGELKHGPIALVHDGSPVIVHAPSDALLCKTISNAEEVLARGAHVIMFTDRKAAEQVSRSAHDIVVLPGEGAAAIFSHVVALQLLAYHVSICLGRDPDRPRNLAKSVTVE
jgi:glucosamine--fructose-6-phosphate aminotransferase (isomerizing)